MGTPEADATIVADVVTYLDTLPLQHCRAQTLEAAILAPL
jgi:hypothetical protein